MRQGSSISLLAVAPLYLRSARFYKCVGTSTRRTKLSLNRKRCVTAVLRLFIFTFHFHPFNTTSSYAAALHFMTGSTQLLFICSATGSYGAALHLRPAHTQLLFLFFFTSPAAALHFLPFICLGCVMTSSYAAALHFLLFILFPGCYDQLVSSCSSSSSLEFV